MSGKYEPGEEGLCPFCKLDGNPEGGGVIIEDGWAYQKCYCTECGGQWEDQYKLFSYYTIEEAENEESV